MHPISGEVSTQFYQSGHCGKHAEKFQKFQVPYENGDAPAAEWLKNVHRGHDERTNIF